MERAGLGVAAATIDERLEDDLPVLLNEIVNVTENATVEQLGRQRAVVRHTWGSRRPLPPHS